MPPASAPAPKSRPSPPGRRGTRAHRRTHRGAPDERRHGKIQLTNETAGQAATRCLELAAMRLFPSGHFPDFLDRRDEKFIHLPAYLVVRYIDSGAVEVGAYGFENLARAVFLDFGSDEAACEIFRIRAGHTEFSSGPKSEPFIAPRPCLEFQFFVMGEFRFESMLPLVESRHDTPLALLRVRV